MKKLIILLCLASVVFAHKGGRGGGKGSWKSCNVTRPENTEEKVCCPNKSTALTALSFNTCKAQCKSDSDSSDKSKGRGKGKGRGFGKCDFCCLTKCALQNVTTNGVINANLMISALTSQPNVTDAWKPAVTTIVNTCIENAQANIQKMKDEVAAANESDISVFIKKKILNCTNSDQIVTEHCIKTKLFYDCPTRVTSDSCDALYTYAQTCPNSFFYDHRMGKSRRGGRDSGHEGGGKSKGGRGGRGRDRQQQSDNDD